MSTAAMPAGIGPSPASTGAPPGIDARAAVTPDIPEMTYAAIGAAVAGDRTHQVLPDHPGVDIALDTATIIAHRGQVHTAEKGLAVAIVIGRMKGSIPVI